MRFEKDIKRHTAALHVFFCAVAELCRDSGRTPFSHGSVLLFAFALERVLTSEDKG